jgi:pyruvate-formate lyase-activating enzyme
VQAGSTGFENNGYLFTNGEGIKTVVKTENNYITALVADENGNIFELDGFAAVGMEADTRVALTRHLTKPIPHGSELMFLPDRLPVLYNIADKKFETLKENPYRPGEPIFPVAAFNSPGYVIRYVAAYLEKEKAAHLPLFSYGAVGWQKEGFRTAIIQVDKEKRQDLRFMKEDKILSGIRKMRKRMPGNRLRRHLENCAMTYGCPAGKNFFLGRYEAPLPTARQCNARCLGCLSFQEKNEIPVSQNRITFTPSPDEIAEVAETHIQGVKKAVVSFGQGCEGDPLMAADVVAPAIRKIRSRTEKGTINVNTNGSRPMVIEQLIDAGLDSMRISLNSIRQECYHRYFRPKGYQFSDVEKSIDLALERGKFVSINYLNCPGFTDTPKERDALIHFLRKHPIRMIQWRNLNYDPVKYWDLMNRIDPGGHPVGMAALLKQIKTEFPHLMHGYFNPPKERFQESAVIKSA